MTPIESSVPAETLAPDAGAPPQEPRGASLEDGLPGAGLDPARMPGHWLLARLGKRVLRPGGLALTRSLLDALDIRDSDDVVEFAPGMGATTRLVLALGPATYTGIERDEAAAQAVRSRLDHPDHRCMLGTAEQTGLPGACATVVFGEAMLTMQRAEQKERIVREARRLLRPGGRYGIHELCLLPDDLDEATKASVQRELSATIHVGARPLTPWEWKELLAGAGFAVRAEVVAPMRLLEPRQLVRDEGVRGTARFVRNALRDPVARRRVGEMRRLFHRHRHLLGAIALAAAPTGE